SVQEFLDQVRTVTYDCPDPSFKAELESFLSSSVVDTNERFELLVTQTHYQNCSGQSSKAQSTLQQIINNPAANKKSQYFASATYQLGFTFDVQEDNERCEHYRDALRLSKDNFKDIEMSSTLGLITNCSDSGYTDDSKKLAAYFALLEEYAEAENPRALAHIHNSIGLFFGVRQQHVLAADQYLKAYEMGKDVYRGSNKLSTLISAITSLLSSSQFEKAFEAIEEFAELNKDVNTPLSNFWYYYAKASYYYRSDNIAELGQILPDLAAVLPAVDNPFYRGLYRWLSTVPCLHSDDIACLRRFTEKENSLDESEKPYENYHYNKFLIRANFAVGDVEAASIAFEKNIQQLDEIKENRNGLSEVIGIANLYGQIYVLENEILIVERRKQQAIIAAVVIMVLTLIMLLYVVRKRQIARRSMDPSTQLLNSKSAIDRIVKTDLPSEGNINALAIFDLGNFREVNLKIGSTKGEYVLKSIAKTLKRVTRKNDVLGRFAPEQFILCLKDIEESSAKSFFERVQEALESTFAHEDHGKEISVRSSMSIYITNERFDDIKTVLEEMLLSLSIRPNNLGSGHSDS
ncbi:unnamed protein product, partial [Ectocarpus sp. 12 AP-2014]